MTDGAAESLYARINSEDDIDHFITTKKAEDLYLDFKRTQNPAMPDLDDDVRKFLAKSLSGFANSAGGVIVIGVGAPQKGPYAKYPISDISTFEQRVLEQISRATTPPVPRVVTKTVLSKDSTNSGFVIVLVPESDLVPHRCHVDKMYYHRSGDSFASMEHYQIADMFGRRYHPVLQVVGRLNKASRGQRGVVITVMIQNSGRSIARFPALSIDEKSDLSPDQFGIDGNCTFGLPQWPNAGSYGNFRGGANEVIHAGLTIAIMKLKSEVQINEGTNDHVQDVIVAGVITAEHLPPKRFKIFIPRKDLIQALHPTTASQYPKDFKAEMTALSD